MLNLQQLRYFVAVAQTEHVGRAALALNLTQSPLSRQIQGLEAQLGVTLFHRSKKRLKLTGAGQDFLEHARQLLDHAARVERHLQNLAAGAEGTLIIGYVEGALHSGLLARTLQAFRRTAPAAQLQLKALRSGEQFRQLASREIDIGLSYAVPSVASELCSRKLFEEPFKLALAAERRTAVAPTPKQLDGATFIASPEAASPSGRQALVTACEAAGFRPDIRYEALDPLAVLEMVSAGLGLAIVQASLERIKPKGVVFANMPKRFAMSMQIHMAWAPDCTMLANIFRSAAI